MAPLAQSAPNLRTTVAIREDRFFINGKPAYAGRGYEGMKIDWLLMNHCKVQAIFDALSPETRGKWAHSDARNWALASNTREFPARPEWRKHRFPTSTTSRVNLAGRSPGRYSKRQPWANVGDPCPSRALMRLVSNYGVNYA